MKKDPEKKRQAELPGVFENVKTFPDLDRAMNGLRELREEFADAGQKVAKARLKITTLLKAHKVPTYVAAGLKVELKPGEEQLAISKIKPPKDDKPAK